MVDETGVDKPKVDEMAVDEIAVDEPGPHQTFDLQDICLSVLFFRGKDLLLECIFPKDLRFPQRAWEPWYC